MCCAWLRALETNLNPNTKAMGPDTIPTCTPELAVYPAKLLQCIYNMTVIRQCGKFACSQKVEQIQSNYLPISFFSIICKMMESVVDSALSTIWKAYLLILNLGHEPNSGDESICCWFQDNIWLSLITGCPVKMEIEEKRLQRLLEVNYSQPEKSVPNFHSAVT